MTSPAPLSGLAGSLPPVSTAGVLVRPGARLAYEVTGDGPGRGARPRVRAWTCACGTRRPITWRRASGWSRYDCRGFGASGPFDPAAAYTHAGDLLALLDHLGIEQAVLAGLSFGGRVVMQAALAAPDRVRGPGAARRGARRRPLGPRVGRGDSMRPPGRPRPRGLLAGRAAWLAHPLFAAARRAAATVASALAAMVAGYPGQHWTGYDPHQQTEPRPIDALEDLTMPVLVAVGERTCRASARCPPCSPAASPARGTTSWPTPAT